MQVYFGNSVQWYVLICVMGASVGEIGEYTHEWAVTIEGGDNEAEELAKRHDFEVSHKVFDDVYVLRHRRLARRSVKPSTEHHQRLLTDPTVRWAEQQRVKRRVKRDLLPHLTSRSYGIAQLNDPKWPQMWYLNRGGALDMNVQAAWEAGATGKGVVVTILDDGLEKDHPDLIKNYDPNASYDVNNHDPDPMPRYDLVDSNRHGTRCAGEVAADANNSICAVGVAYEASVGGVRMLDGDVTDDVEARSLALNPQHIDIYSASWGPDDDGKTVDGPGRLATRAFVEGIRNGRNGKGSIYIWASGNGGRDQDNCNCDGYTNSIWTLSISSATEKGQVPWYSEACSSTLATTYSSGSLGERQIITTDLHHCCTTSHTGTSASAPLAAGICALALQVNRDLTWRDMQHIVVRTARPEKLDAPDWQINGVGRHVSHRFGYGLLDSYGMVKLARNWTNVPAQRTCDVEAPYVDKLIPQKSLVSLELDVINCPGVNFLEHVQAKVSLSADRRGDIEIYLSSPAGTKSTLLAQRPHDNSRTGFHSWPFLTVHMWGERPLGKWVLEVHNNGHFFTTGKADVKNWSLTMYGTETEPGQEVPPLSGDHHTISQNDPTVHQVVDTTEGKTEARDPGTPVSQSSPSTSTASPHPTPQSLTLEKAVLPAGCLRTSAAGACLECMKDLYLFNGQCLKTCSPGHYPWDPQNEGVTGVPSCLSCHYSCYSCSGPQDYQCTKCWGDAELYSISKGQNQCQPTSLLSAYRRQESWYLALVGTVVGLVVVTTVLCLLLFRGNRRLKYRENVKGPNGSMMKPAVNGKIGYHAMPQETTDKLLLTSIPFRDLTSSEDEEREEDI